MNTTMNTSKDSDVTDEAYEDLNSFFEEIMQDEIPSTVRIHLPSIWDFFAEEIDDEVFDPAPLFIGEPFTVISSCSQYGAGESRDSCEDEAKTERILSRHRCAGTNSMKIKGSEVRNSRNKAVKKKVKGKK